jgi:hypothetical protein
MAWLAALSAPAPAKVIEWISPFVGNWANSTNWNPGFEPTAADDAVIERNGSRALVTTGGRTARSVTLGGSGGGSVTIAPGSLTVNSFIIVGPSAGGFGTLIIDAGGSATAQNLR